MNATKLIRVLNTARKLISNELTLQQLSVFALIAEAGEAGTNHAAIITRLDLGRSQASKIPLDLSDRTSNKSPGPGLVETWPDPMDLRSKVIKLTAKGKRIAQEVFA